MPFEERGAECATNTQYIVGLSAYRWAVEMLPDIADMRVLDVACGTGYGSAALAAWTRSVVGVDRDLPTVLEATRRYGRPNLWFLPMEGEALALRSASIDAVVSFETIEHVHDDRWFLREIGRVLTSDGWLVLSTPHAPKPGAVPDNPFHLREYTWGELRDRLGEHFASVRLFGRRLSPRLARLEQELNRVRRLDPGAWRRLVPRKIRHRLGSLLSWWRAGVGLEDITTADVEYSEGLTATPTLLAVCRRTVR